MKDQIGAYIDSAMTVILLVVAALTPLLFLNQLTEFYEMPKMVFLVVATVILLGLWIFSWIIKGKVTITRTPLDIPLVVLLVVVVLSAYFSDSRYTTIYGNLPRVHGSAVSWVTYILLYFVTVSHLNTIAKIRTFLYTLYGSAAVAAILSVLSFFGLFLPVAFARAVNFTPTGSSFSTIAFLLLLLPLPLLSLINPNKYLPLPAAMALTILFGVTVILIGALPTYVVLLLVCALTFLISKPQQLRRTLPYFLIPLVVTALVLVLSYLPLPGPLNVLHQTRTNFPQEIQLPFGVSWKVSASAFRDAPFIGTGPSTFLYNFTSYKPIEFNQLTYWNFAFDTAYNEYLQILATLGFVGLAALVLVTVAILVSSRKNIGMNHEAAHDATHIVLPALAISGIVAVVLLLIHATTLVSMVGTLFVLAAFMASQRSIRERVTELSVGFQATTGNTKFDLLPVVIFILFVVAGATVLFNTYKATMADHYHRQALAQASRSGQLTYQNLQRAESLNRYVDLYRVDLAQTNFALANAIAASKIQQAQSQKLASPGAALTDQDRQTIQTLLSQSINEGRVAVALSPRSARNWEVLASIYRNITGVSQNALAFSLDAYGRAIQRDPLNPALRVNVGGIYYAIRNYDLAIRFFSDAANLKPDYANAYYNLAIALRDKGDLRNAQLVAEQTVSLLRQNQKSVDYKTATELLSDIKAKVTAAQSTSALGNQNIGNVDVSNLNNPPTEVATPAAVQRNPKANLPQLTPTPSARR